MTEPAKILIIVQGGSVQSILTAGLPVECVVIDYDNHAFGCEGGDAIAVPQGDGSSAPASVDLCRTDDTPEGRALAEWAFTLTNPL
jgi:hypothetical protein